MFQKFRLRKASQLFVKCDHTQKEKNSGLVKLLKLSFSTSPTPKFEYELN